MLNIKIFKYKLRYMYALELYKQMVNLLLKHPWLLLLTILPNIINLMLKPAEAWLAKEVFSEVIKGDNSFLLTSLLQYIPIVIGIFIVLSLLEMSEKMTDKMLDERLYISTQRLWFSRKKNNSSVSEDISKSVYDCKLARKSLDILKKDIWVVIVGLPSVIIWQISLAEEYVLPLLIVGIFPFLISLCFGKLIAKYSNYSLQFISSVSSAIANNNVKDMYTEQEKYYKTKLSGEWWQQCSEVLSNTSHWLIMAIMILLSVYDIIPLLPKELSPPDVAAFLVNLKLINKPFQELVALYNELHKAYPAIKRVLRP